MDFDGLIKIDFSMSISLDEEDSPYCQEINGLIYGLEEGVNRVEVGHLRAYYIDVFLGQQQHIHILDILDEHSDTAPFVVLYDDSGRFEDVYDAISNNLLIIDRIEIFPEYRGNGIGSNAVKRTIKTYGRESGLVALKSFPLQFEGKNLEKEQCNSRGSFNEASNKLGSYYAKLGFEHTEHPLIMVFKPS